MKKETKISYDLLGERAPQMPKKLPAFLEFAVSNAPKHTRAAFVNALFPPLGALMHNVKFRYQDGRLHEPHFFAGLVGPMAVGKGAIDPIIESIIRSLRAHDELSYAERKAERYLWVISKIFASGIRVLSFGANMELHFFQELLVQKFAYIVEFL